MSVLCGTKRGGGGGCGLYSENTVLQVSLSPEPLIWLYSVQCTHVFASAAACYDITVLITIARQRVSSIQPLAIHQTRAGTGG